MKCNQQTWLLFWTTWLLLITFWVFCPSVRGLQSILEVCQADCMKLFSAAAKLFVWCLRLRVQKARPSHCWHWVYKSKMCFQLQKFGDCIIYWALRWQRHSETNAISIWSSKQAATFFFPMFEHSEKCTHSFLLQVHVCIIIIGVISERHTSPDRVRPITLVAALCTTCRGDRVLVVTKFNVTFLPLRPY